MTLLTRGEKEAIRNSPCGRCHRVPPFEDGSRCQPHRIVPGCEGGKYTRENTVPRCNGCHDIEHGGTGEAPFIGAAVIGGRISDGRPGGRASTQARVARWQRAGLNAAEYNQRLTAARKASTTRKGTKHSAAAREKMSAARRARGRTLPAGFRHSAETREKISAVKKGRTPNRVYSCSPETRAKIAASLRGNIPWNKGKRLHEVVN